MAYSEKVMDHFQHPRNVGEIENASGVGTVGNAKCGDIMRIFLDIDDETHIIKDCKFKTFGCGAAVATSSMATEMVMGKTIEEAMEVTNKAVMEAAGAEIPTADTTWDQFLETCQVIKNAGYTPIATSLAKEPHYWFEFAIYNHDSAKTHTTVPEAVDDAAGEAWQAGLADIKDLYEKGFLSENTNTATGDEVFQSFLEGKSAFYLDGSWKMGGIKEGTATTALKNGAEIDESSLTNLEKDALAMPKDTTGITGAVQDLVTQDERAPIFDNMPQIVEGQTEITDALQEMLDIIEENAE